jgi:hypothetical protein
MVMHLHLPRLAMTRSSVLALGGFLFWGCGGNLAGNSSVDASSGADDGGGATTVDGSIDAPAVDGSIDSPSESADAYSGPCMISASSYDQSCAVDTDCTIVTSTNYCTTNCLCGGSAINVGALAKFNGDVSKTPLGSGALGGAACPCAAPFGPCCRGGQCTGECFSPTDTLSTCADAGGMCLLADKTTCGGAVGPPDACAYSDETCCLN